MGARLRAVKFAGVASKPGKGREPVRSNSGGTPHRAHATSDAGAIGRQRRQNTGPAGKSSQDRVQTGPPLAPALHGPADRPGVPRPNCRPGAGRRSEILAILVLMHGGVARQRARSLGRRKSGLCRGAPGGFEAEYEPIPSRRAVPIHRRASKACHADHAAGERRASSLRSALSCRERDRAGSHPTRSHCGRSPDARGHPPGPAAPQPAAWSESSRARSLAAASCATACAVSLVPSVELRSNAPRVRRRTAAATTLPDSESNASRA